MCSSHVDYHSIYLTVYLEPSVPYRNGYLNLLFSFYKSFTCISKMCFVVKAYLYFNCIYLCNVHLLFLSDMLSLQEMVYFFYFLLFFVFDFIFMKGRYIGNQDDIRARILGVKNQTK